MVNNYQNINMNVCYLMNNFHGKNKRFKKEIKDRMTIIETIDNIKQKIIIKIKEIMYQFQIKFSKRNGTMEILQFQKHAIT